MRPPSENATRTVVDKNANHILAHAVVINTVLTCCTTKQHHCSVFEDLRVIF